MAKKSDKTSLVAGAINWSPLSAVIVVIAVYLISQIVAAFVVAIYPALRGWSSSQATAWLNNSVIAQFWITVFIEGLVVLLLWFYLKNRHTNFKSLGLKGKPKWVDVGYVLAGFLVYFVVYYVVIQVVHGLIPSFNPNQKQNLGYNTDTTGPILTLVFISLVILPPIVEEILFRGFLYTGLRTKMPKIIAALITSAIFASLHLLEGTSGILWVAGIDTFILSMVLVYLRDHTDKLWASMGLHMLKNAIAFMALFVFHIS